jgi:hypothetical protein
VLAISAVFAVLMSAGLYAAKDPTRLFGSKPDADTKGVPGLKAVGLIGTNGLGADDPVLRFSETKVGQVVFSSARSDTCRRVLFDNSTGARLEAGEVYCRQTVDQVVEAETPNRLQSLRKSFQK